MNTNKNIAGQNQKTEEIISQRRGIFTNAINANVNKSILFGLKEEDIATFLSPQKMGGGGEEEELKRKEAELKRKADLEIQASFKPKFKTQKLAWDKSDQLGKGVIGVTPLPDPLEKEAELKRKEAELKRKADLEIQASFKPEFKTQKLAWDKSDQLGKGVVGVAPLPDPLEKEPETQDDWSNLLHGLDALANFGERVTNESDLNVTNKLYNQMVAENLFNTVSASRGYNTINPTISGVASPNLAGYTNQIQGYAALGGDKQSTSFQKGAELEYDENTLKELDKLGIKYKIVTE